RETAIKGGFETRPYGNHPNRPMVDSRAWLTPKSAKAFSAGIRKSAVTSPSDPAGADPRRVVGPKQGVMNMPVKDDPIVAEVHRARAKIFKACGNDI
ncbi:MAG: hypothetical protein ABIF71_10715, partial [Planctomycetota bacterium]